MSKIRQFTSSLPPAPNKSADPSGGQPVPSPDDLFAQTLQSSGYKLGADPCEDQCWEAYQRCLKQSLSGSELCRAQLQTCRDNCARNKLADTGLVAVDPIYVSKDGGNSVEASPKLDVEYVLCVKVVNKATTASGPFLVVFDVDGGQQFQQKKKEKADLKAGDSVLMVAPYGKFPKAAKYELAACVHYANAPPNKRISCATPLKFVVK